MRFELCDNLPMNNPNIYTGYRYPSQIISHAVWTARQGAT
jgi:hypothetical protein